MAPWLEPTQGLSHSEWTAVEAKTGILGPMGATQRQADQESATETTPEAALRVLADCRYLFSQHHSGLAEPTVSSLASINETQRDQTGPNHQLTLDEFQIIKAVVLGLVTSIILLSICKMVFQIFVRYAAKSDDR